MQPLASPVLSRRAFVRSSVLAAGGVALAGCLGEEAPAPPLERVEYLGAALLGGPAQRGVPLFPLRVDLDGRLSFQPSAEGVGSVLPWYRYCGREASPPLRGEHRPEDEFVRYFLTEEKRETIEEGWYKDRLGEVARAADFDEVGKGAGVIWRSAGVRARDLLTGIVLKVDPAKLTFGEGVDGDLVRRAFMVPTDDGGLLAAFHSACTHFCCVMGWHESRLAEAQGLWDTLFCNCHLVVCDPFRVTRDFFLADAPTP